MAGLFDNLSDTAWDPNGDDPQSTLEFDLGKVQPIGSIAFSQRSQRLGWHQYFRYELKAGDSDKDPWRSVYRATRASVEFQ